MTLFPNQPFPVVVPSGATLDKVDRTDWAQACMCGGEIPLARPSGTVVCRACGRPWEIVPVRQPLP